MTTADDITRDNSHASEIECAHVAWSLATHYTRGPLGRFMISFLRQRGLEIVPIDELRPKPLGDEAADGLAELAGLLLPESPFTEQALAMGVEDVADLLAALAERDLHWTAGEHGQCGVLREGHAEPRDRSIVFDALGMVWQRDDQRAEKYGHSARWYGLIGAGHPRRWAELCRDLGPLTPEGGITPPARDEQGDDGCEGGPR